MRHPVPADDQNNSNIEPRPITKMVASQSGSQLPEAPTSSDVSAISPFAIAVISGYEWKNEYRKSYNIAFWVYMSLLMLIDFIFLHCTVQQKKKYVIVGEYTCISVCMPKLSYN